MRATDENIFNALDRLIKPGQETAWKTIVSSVSSEIPIKNWLKVRGVLQYMINEGMIERTDSVHVEHYIRVKNEDDIRSEEVTICGLPIK